MVANSKPTLSLVSRRVNGLRRWIRVCHTAQGIKEWKVQNSDRSGFEKSIAQNVNENAAYRSQVWHQNENNRSGIGKSVAKAYQRSRLEKAIAIIQSRLAETRSTHHNFEIFNVPYLEKLFADVRQKLSRR